MDMALEDVISADKGGRRKGRSKGGAGKAERKRENGEGNTSQKLEMSLEDVITTEVRPKGKGRGKRGDKGHGKSSSTKKAWQVAGRKIWGGAKSTKNWATISADGTEREACMVYVGGCPHSITEAQVKDKFGKFGTIEEIAIKHLTKDAYAFVIYSKESEAQAAIKALHETTVFGGDVIKVVARKGYTGRRRDAKGSGKGKDSWKGAGKGKSKGKSSGSRREDRRDDYDYRPSRRENRDAQRADSLQAENDRLQRELEELRRAGEQPRRSRRVREEEWNGGSRSSWKGSGGSSHRAEREGKTWSSSKDDAWSEEKDRNTKTKERWEEEPAARRSSKWDGAERGTKRAAAGAERGSKRTREYDPAASGEPRTSAGGRKRIKVTNLPRGLGWRDIKDSFEREAGKISRCEVEGNAAWISFVRTEDAKKAVQTFDRGELNGRTIGVTLED